MVLPWREGVAWCAVACHDNRNCPSRTSSFNQLHGPPRKMPLETKSVATVVLVGGNRVVALVTTRPSISSSQRTMYVIGSSLRRINETGWPELKSISGRSTGVPSIVTLNGTRSRTARNVANARPLVYRTAVDSPASHRLDTSILTGTVPPGGMAPKVVNDMPVASRSTFAPKKWLV